MDAQNDFVHRDGGFISMILDGQSISKLFTKDGGISTDSGEKQPNGTY